MVKTDNVRRKPRKEHVGAKTIEQLQKMTNEITILKSGYPKVKAAAGKALASST